ncbi:MAG: class I SAM-dependent methyltransferase [Reyranellaceae bacterium]
MTARALKTLAKGGWHWSFRLLQRAGINFLPAHFYSCVPDLGDLARRSDWRRPRSMHGIDHRDIDRQVALVDEWLAPQAEHLGRRSIHAEAIVGGGGDGGYGEIEAQVLFAFVATNKPGRVTQVGCGVSTAVILMAAEAAGYKPEVICIEPYPSPYLRAAEKKGAIRLVAEPAQMVDYERLADLAAGDLLFVDSTHAVKPGSEVNYLIHEVLPRLRSGVWVHFHDIYFPYDYTRGTLSDDLFFPQESTLLYAFLTGNDRYRLEASLSMIHYAAAERLQRLIPGYQPNDQKDGLAGTAGRHFPSSAWLRAVGR